MVQRTVMKVDIACLKCKKRLLRAVTRLEGVDIIEADAAKGTLSVTGTADPHDIIVRSRKTGKCVEVVSIGPPPAPPKKPEDKNKPEEKKPGQKAHNCAACDQMTIVWTEPYQSCSIL